MLAVQRERRMDSVAFDTIVVTPVIQEALIAHWSTVYLQYPDGDTGPDVDLIWVTPANASGRGALARIIAGPSHPACAPPCSDETHSPRTNLLFQTPFGVRSNSFLDNIYPLRSYIFLYFCRFRNTIPTPL